MIQQCAWCGATIGRVKGSRHPDSEVSHGICRSCYERLTFQQGVPLQKYLDSLSLPVVVVDRYGIVKAANDPACGLLSKDRREIIQHLGGNVFECAYATLPEGCGGTVHCSGCAIRRTVLRTYETGEAQSRVPATLKRGTPDHPDPVVMTITTVKAGDVVLLRIETMDGRS